MVARESLVSLRVLLLMLFSNQESNLLNLFLLGWEFHHGSKEPVFKIAEKLVIMNWHERQFLLNMKPANPLVDDVWEACKCLKVVSLSFQEGFIHNAHFIGALYRDDTLPFGQTDFLEILLQNWKQLRSVLLLVHRQVQNYLYFVIMKHLQEKNLGQTDQMQHFWSFPYCQQ